MTRYLAGPNLHPTNRRSASVIAVTDAERRPRYVGLLS